VNGYNLSYIKAKMDQAVKKIGLTHDDVTVDPVSKTPPGQYKTDQFPILDLGVRPPIELNDFRLKVYGETQREPFELTFDELTLLPSVSITKDFNCVTRWTKQDIKWKGVPFTKIVELAKPTSMAKYVIFGSRDGYTTNVPLVECLKYDVIVAYELYGKEIPLVHGGPVRMIIPGLYGWKSAKFLSEIKFSEIDEPGFWEIRGYNNEGSVNKEQRFS
jgi:DMSO/TMAO reductase YedYZ molybdopterin-dependent catalytic subunit